MKKNLWALIFSLAYVVAFTAFYVNKGDFEFLWYVAVLIFFFLFILLTLHKSGFDRLTVWGLAMWGFLHMAGGGIPIGDKVLYAVTLIPFIENGEMTILKFDQFVHFFGFFVATLVGYHLLRAQLKLDANWKVIFALLVLIGMGFGVVNEIVEFIAVVSFPETGVGGYINTSLDLVFNALGAIAAAFFIKLSSTT